MEIGKETESNGTQASTVEMGEVPRAIVLKVYKRRIWMVILFSILSMLCGMMFPMYVVMEDVTSCFYGVNEDTINWTTLIFMVVYIILVFPASSLINHMDLRWTVICASFFNFLGCATQFATLVPTSFSMVMLASFFASMSNLFVLGVPPFLAARWFPSNELSRACAFGVFGNQLGVAMGFIFSPLLVTSDCNDKDLIAFGKRNVALVQTIVNAVVFLLIIFTFQNAPPVPPSLAQIVQNKEEPESHASVVWSMLKNVNFIMVFVMYGLMVGTYFALSTNLDVLILHYFPGHDIEVGWMGMLLIASGIVGSAIASYILDHTHKFKETSLGICIGSLLTYLVFSYLLVVPKMWVQFITISVFGFFLTSFLPIGFEYGIEVTYPQSEATSACLLNASTQIFGIILTELSTHFLEKFGPISADAALSVTLLLSCITTCFVTKHYRRTKQNNAPHHSISL